MAIDPSTGYDKDETYPDIDLRNHPGKPDSGKRYALPTRQKPIVLTAQTAPITTELKTAFLIYEYERNGVGGVIQQPEPFMVDGNYIYQDGNVVAQKDDKGRFVSPWRKGSVQMWTWQPDYSCPSHHSYYGVLKLQRDIVSE